jgi:hypothetical protein
MAPQRRRRKNRKHIRLNAQINNEDTLKRIASLPQQILDDSSIAQFFNGFPM